MTKDEIFDDSEKKVKSVEYHIATAECSGTTSTSCILPTNTEDYLMKRNDDTIDWNKAKIKEVEDSEQ